MSYAIYYEVEEKPKPPGGVKRKGQGGWYAPLLKGLNTVHIQILEVLMEKLEATQIIGPLAGWAARWYFGSKHSPA
ncbi:MAG: hypothetical protein HYU02_03875 [Thaumarchaeota archaeon]|nr:hypothetical protein [Nitrososphaerota archaeon]